MKYNFVVYKGDNYFNSTIDLLAEETIDDLFDKLQILAYDATPIHIPQVFMFTNKIGVAKFNLWLVEKFGDIPTNKWENEHYPFVGTKSWSTYYIQPFGKIHVIEV